MQLWVSRLFALSGSTRGDQTGRFIDDRPLHSSNLDVICSRDKNRVLSLDGCGLKLFSNPPIKLLTVPHRAILSDAEAGTRKGRIKTENVSQSELSSQFRGGDDKSER